MAEKRVPSLVKTQVVAEVLSKSPSGAGNGKMPKPLRLGKDCDYERELGRLQIELVKLHEWIRHKGLKVVILFEGRDAAGKGSAIKRITQTLNPRICRVVALGTPTEREKTQWYFQRYVAHLPAAGEMVLFDRSWYNRAGVERVMGFCSEAQARGFLKAVVPFEAMLVHSGLQLVKYYLDISRDEQRKRLKKRAGDPLTQWKISPVDQAAAKKWDAYTRARDEMLAASSSAAAPWTMVHTDDKREARLNIIRDLVQRIDYPRRDRRLALPDPRIVFGYSKAMRNRLAK